MIDYLSRPKMTERQKHRKIRRQKEEKAEKFERLNCISANSNDISISLNHIFLLMRPIKSFFSLLHGRYQIPFPDSKFRFLLARGGGGGLVSSRFFDLLNSIIYELKRSVDLR